MVYNLKKLNEKLQIEKKIIKIRIYLKYTIGNDHFNYWKWYKQLKYKNKLEYTLLRFDIKMKKKIMEGNCCVFFLSFRLGIDYQSYSVTLFFCNSKKK